MTPAPAVIPKSSDSTCSSIALTDILSFFQDKYLLTPGAQQQCVRTKNYALRHHDHPVWPASAGAGAGFRYQAPGRTRLCLRQLHRRTVTGRHGQRYHRHPFWLNLCLCQNKQIELGVKRDTSTLLNILAIFQIIRPSLIKDSDNNKYTSDSENAIAALNGVSPEQPRWDYAYCKKQLTSRQLIPGPVPVCWMEKLPQASPSGCST